MGTRHATEDHQAKMALFFQQGCSVEEIAGILGFGKQTVRAHLRTQGLTLRGSDNFYGLSDDEGEWVIVGGVKRWKWYEGYGPKE